MHEQNVVCFCEFRWKRTIQDAGSIQEQVDMETEWITANEAAQYLKVKPRTLLQWVRERKIPAHRLSGVRRCVWRFRKHELDAILCSSSAEPAEGRQQ
jgi:excisionase family DNA binding protein